MARARVCVCVSLSLGLLQMFENMHSTWCNRSSGVCHTQGGILSAVPHKPAGVVGWPIGVSILLTARLAPYTAQQPRAKWPWFQCQQRLACCSEARLVTQEAAGRKATRRHEVSTDTRQLLPLCLEAQLRQEVRHPCIGWAGAEGVVHHVAAPQQRVFVQVLCLHCRHRRPCQPAAQQPGACCAWLVVLLGCRGCLHENVGSC